MLAGAMMVAPTTVGTAKPAKADLVVRAVVASQGAVEVGAGFQASVTVGNVGSGKASSSITRFYLSEDQRKGKSDLELAGEAGISALGPRRTTPGSTTVIVSGDVRFRSYYVIACADAKAKIRELREKNNCGSSGKRLRVVAAAPKPAPGVTSGTAIDAAVEAGNLNPQTGLIYKVFADFNDPRLPMKYRGSTGLGGVLAQVAYEFPSLSPETKRALVPFLIPPYHPGSWWALENGVPLPSSAAITTDDPQLRCPIRYAPLLQRWNSIATAGNERIWWQQRYPDDKARAEALARALDGLDGVGIRSRLVDLMKRGPLADGGRPCNGGDGRLDISLVDISPPLGETVPFGLNLWACSEVPAYILLRRSASASVLAHEFMHAIQLAFEVRESCREYEWWREASAQWAEDFVFAADNEEQDVAPFFLNDTAQPLETRNQAHEYGAYLLPFYLARRAPPFGAGLIRTIWENDGSYDSLRAIDEAVPGGFADLWPRFVLRNWNRDPVADYQLWDDLLVGAKTSEVGAAAAGDIAHVHLDARGSAELKLARNLEHLSARYYRIDLSDPSIRSVAFHNPYAGLKDGAALAQALVRIDGKWKQPEDWSAAENKVFCRDDPAERIDELVLILSNSSYLKDHVVAPFWDPSLVATNIDCLRWEGSAAGTAHVTAMGFPRDVTETWTASNLVIESNGTEPAAATRIVGGSVNWEAKGTIGDCSFSAGPVDVSLTQPDAQPTANVFMYGLRENLPPAERWYHVLGEYHKRVDGTLTCPPRGPASYGYDIFPAWLNTTSDGNPVTEVRPDGTLEGKSHQIVLGPPNVDVSWEWHFSPQP